MSSGVKSWSQTAANNDDADSAVNYAEGQAPSTLNDAGRGLMSSVAKYRDDTAGSLETGGTTTAYTLTSNQVFASLTEMNGQELAVRFDQANGATPTLNVDSLGAKAININESTAVPTGFIAAGSIWRVTYDNSIPAFILNGASNTGFVDITASGTVTGADLAATDDLTVGDDASVGGDLTVTGSATAADLEATDDLTVGDDASIGGDLSVTGVVTAANSAGIASRNTAKAYATFSATGGTVTSDAEKRFNVSGITRNSIGNYTITFSTAMANTNYIVVGTGRLTASTIAVGVTATTRNTGTVVIETRTTSSAGLGDVDVCDVVILGY